MIENRPFRYTGCPAGGTELVDVRIDDRASGIGFFLGFGDGGDVEIISMAFTNADDMFDRRYIFDKRSARFEILLYEDR